MRKIPTLFVRDFSKRPYLVTPEVTPGCEWVLAGEGAATRKMDGACCAVIDGVFYKRYDAKRGKTPPDSFVPAQDPDETTGHWPGWVPIGDSPDDQWFRSAMHNTTGGVRLGDGTYEAVGPHFQGNPEGLDKDYLIRHGALMAFDAPRSFDALRQYLSAFDIEGVVWHHEDGRMAKIKTVDFGLRRAPRHAYTPSLHEQQTGYPEPQPE